MPSARSARLSWPRSSGCGRGACYCKPTERRASGTIEWHNSCHSKNGGEAWMGLWPLQTTPFRYKETETMNIQEQLQQDLKAAMRGGERQRVDVIRMALAALKN